jgi:hypothetical protein
MFVNLVEKDLKAIWNERVGGFIAWQQVFHVLSGLRYWMKDKELENENDYSELKIYQELEKDPEDILTIDQIIKYEAKLNNQIDQYFNKKSDKWLLKESIVDNTKNNLEVIIMEIRHIQYHLGCFEGYLRDKTIKTQEWID